MSWLQSLGVDLYFLWNSFFIFSFIGWAFESTYVSFKEGHLVNRGFITGPFCTVYGCGGVAMFLLLSPLKDRFLLLYLGGVVVCTVIEYITALLMEGIFHAKWWDYSHLRFNFQGRICLSSSLVWGLFALGLMKIVYPVTVWFVGLYPREKGETALFIISIVFAIDFVVSWVEAARMAGKFEKIAKILSEISTKIDESKVGELLDDINEKLEETHFSEKTEGIKAKLLGYYDKYTTMIKESNLVQQRFMRAYPVLRNTISNKQEQLLNTMANIKTKITNLVNRGE